MNSKKTIPLAEHYDPKRTLADRFDELSDASEICSHTDSRVNALITGFVLKYLSDYLQIQTTDLSKLALEVRTAIRVVEERDLQRILYSTLFTGEPEGHSDVFGLQCLSDVASTAALVKEIAFKDWHPASKSMFTGVDLGSGTGILSIAMAIAAKRHQFNSIRLGLIDSQSQSLSSSKRVISQIPTVQGYYLQTNLVNPNLYTTILHESDFVDYWVSETFGECTPRITSLSHSECMTDEGGSWFADAYDPYISVLRNLLRYRSSFYQQVLSKSSAFFPDPINDSFRPNWQKGTIKMTTSSNPDQFVPYDKVGSDFATYAMFGSPNVRWGFRDN